MLTPEERERFDAHRRTEANIVLRKGLPLDNACSCVMLGVACVEALTFDPTHVSAMRAAERAHGVGFLTRREEAALALLTPEPSLAEDADA